MQGIVEAVAQFASMLARIAFRRLLLAVPLVFVIVTVTFFLIHLAPGDPAYILAGDAPSPEFLASVRNAYGLDQPVWRQFITFLTKAVTGDFGQSIFYKAPVFEVILDRFPATLQLTFAAMALATFLGIAFGVTAAASSGSRLDVVVSSLSLVGYSIPVFWMGQILVLLFSVKLGWLPAGGMTTVRYRYTGLDYVGDVAVHMALPVTTLAIFLATMIARFARAAMVEALDQDFVVVAQAKGATRWRILWHHAFRNALVTTITVVGLEFGAVLAGALVIEVIYGWSGVGRLFYDAIFRRDYPLLTGSFIFSSVVVITVNALTDVACAFADPRLR